MKIAKFLEHSPDYQLQLASKRSALGLNKQLKSFNLNLTQALILVALYFEKDHQADFESLAEAFEVTKGGLSQAISQLEGRALIKRLPKDKRSIRISLKPNAHKICSELIRLFDGRQKAIEEESGEAELKNFLSILKQVSEFSN